METCDAETTVVCCELRRREECVRSSERAAAKCIVMLAFPLRVSSAFKALQMEPTSSIWQDDRRRLDKTLTAQT